MLSLAAIFPVLIWSYFLLNVLFKNKIKSNTKYNILILFILELTSKGSYKNCYGFNSAFLNSLILFIILASYGLQGTINSYSFLTCFSSFNNNSIILFSPGFKFTI